MRHLVLLLAILTLVLGLAPLAIGARGDHVLVSRADGASGAAANGASAIARISPDGRYVVFRSAADNLTDNDNDAVENLFLRDVATGLTQLVNLTNGADGIGSSTGADDGVPSEGGRHVAFDSASSELSADDTDPVTDVFVRGMENGTTTLVSRATGATGAGGDANSSAPAISADGRRVTFFSTADNLAADDDDAHGDVFLRDLDANTTELVSRASGVDGAGGDAVSADAAISADGRHVVFLSSARNLSADDEDAHLDVFIRDLATATTTLVSRATGVTGAAANAGSANPAISADGRFVAFHSTASNLSAQDDDPVEDVFVRDLQEGTTTLVSRATNGTPGDANSHTASISADGRFVLFQSDADSLVEGENEAVSNVFLRDTVANTVTLVTGGADGSSYTYGHALSANGRYATFESDATNFSAEDLDPQSDVFRVDILGEPPACTDATATVAYGQTTAVALPCADAEGDALTRVVVTAPVHGTLGAIDQAAGTIQYTPQAGYSGPDTLTFRASDATASSNVATLDLTVGGPPGACSNRIAGTSAAEQLTGTVFGDRIAGMRGNDVLAGVGGDDCLYGGRGNDRIRGGSGSDTLGGGKGRDRLSGGRGHDELIDRRGVDRFEGGGGNDRIKARDRRRRDRRKRDRVRCGAGQDRVVADRRDRVARSCERVRRVRS